MSVINKYQMYKGNIISFSIAILSGMLYSLGFPLFNGKSLFIAPIIGFILLNWLIDQEKTFNKKMVIALFYSLGFYLLGFYWIPHLLKEFGGLLFPLNYFLGIIFSLVIIPQVYFYVLLKRFTTNPLALAVGYVLLEQFIPQQFPAHLGHTFISLAPELNLVFASLAGAHFYSFFVVLLSLSLLQHLKTKKIPKLYYIFLGIVIVCHIPFNKHSTPHASTPLAVRIVQPNIGNFIKLDSEKGGTNSLRSVFDSYYHLSTKESSYPLNLIIWPETAYPNLFFSDILKKNHEQPFPPLLDAIIEKTGSELFIGGYDSTYKDNDNSYQSDFNAAFHFSKNKFLKEVYHKRRLIPFGEGLPFGPLNSFLSRYITNISYFAEGNRFSSFTTNNNLPFTSVICYEVLFTRFVRDALNEQKQEPQFLINLTNDSWYGETAEPHQHLFLTKWRSLEFNLPVIRSTNTGITTVIYPDGSESSRMGIGEKRQMDLNLSIPKRESTLYQRFGLLSFLTIALALSLIELFIKRKTFFQKIVQTNKT